MTDLKVFKSTEFGELGVMTVNGKEYKIELVEVDNQSDKTAAVTAAQNLVSSGVIAVIGSYGSGVSIAAGSTFEQAKIPAVGGSCTNPQVTLGNDYYFRVCFLDPFQGTVMASYANNEGCKKAAVIMQNGDDYSTGLANYFADAFAKMDGCEVVYTGTYNTNETDFNAILTAAKAADPDVLFIPSSITTAGIIIKQARDMGITARIMAGDTWENATIMENAGVENCEGVALSTFFDENDAEQQTVLHEMGLLSAKPVLYACNVGEDDLMEGIENNKYVPLVAARAKEEGARYIPICAKTEEDIADYSPEEKKAFLAEMGIEASGLDNLITASYDLLGLISFLTDGKKECRAWTIRKGTKAPQAAGKIHSDFERGFIRASVIAYSDLEAHDFDYAAVKAKGLQRTEGKEYVVKDGDVIEFLFNV